MNLQTAVEDESRYLFSFGIPKSGTTYLQMLLDSHPQISCPSEHEFDLFLPAVSQMLTEYNQVLIKKDRVTGRQQPRLFENQDADAIVRFIIKTALHRGADKTGIRWLAANDNGIVTKLPLFAEYFPQAKFLCIVRDPRDIAVSSWFHNLRIGDPVTNSFDGLSSWALNVASVWQQQMLTLLTQAAQFADRLLFIKYEDLLEKPEQEAKELFDFIGADSSDGIITECLRKTSFSKLSANDTQNKSSNEFFRKGESGDWRNHLDEDTHSEIIARAGQMMREFGYI